MRHDWAGGSARVHRQILAELVELRAEVAATQVQLSLGSAEGVGDGDDDFAPHLLIDPASGQTRFGVAQDTLRKWARETQGTAEAIGRLRGHRWELSISRLRKHCGLEPPRAA
jgi:hypothetical protein